jgi:tetratricopeptide (TPR) repeat protein
MNQTFEVFLSGTEIGHRYKISTPGLNAEEPVEVFFELRSDSVELTLSLAALAKAASSGEKPEQELHLAFGQRIYKLMFSGVVGDYWQEHRKSAGRNPLALVLRIDPKTARFLQRIPWEYLHDGKDFLSTNWRTPVYRLPANISAIDFEPLNEALRLLVVIAAPDGLDENEMLHFAKEEDLILAATSQARKTGRLRVEFAPNGSLETLEQYLREYNPHLLHFVGHGVFMDSADSGVLLMETRDGHRRQVWNKDFTQALLKNGRDLRGVFLSACQSAVAPRADGFADLASRLLEEGIPAVTAMQYSVLNISAMAFGSAFYKGIAEGQLIEDVFTDARHVLQTTSPNNVDFATPVLFLSDSNCLRVDLQTGQSVDTPLDLTGLTKAQNFVGRAIEIRELQTRLDPQTGTWRAAVIHAIGGMGKTVLAARLAERLAPRLDGVISIRMAPSTTVQNVLDHMGDILFSNNAHFNLSEIHQYQENRSKPLELRARVSALAQILRKLRLLVILDNCEDILPQGREVSRAAGTEQTALLDPELLPLIAMLVGSVDGPSRFLFTSRVDFSPVEENRLADAIGHLSLKEMGFREAVYLMETLPPLDGLPVVVLNQMSGALSPQPVAMRDVYARLGGHPYRINLFARHAAQSSVSQVLDDLSGVQKELLEFTLLEKAVTQLPERAALLLHRGVVFDEPVPVEALAFMLGDEQDAMPDVATELKALLDWGLAAREPGTENYTLHSLVRDWAKEQWRKAEGKDYLRRAAHYWLGMSKDSHNLWDYLRARQYLYQAGDYEQADDIVQAVVEVFLRSGHLDLLLSLLRQSEHTVEGSKKAAALGNQANVFQTLGDYKTAMHYHQQVRQVFEEAGDRRNLAATLHQIGILHQEQGAYEKALELYQQSLRIEEEIGNRAGIAASLHQIGKVHQDQGAYEKALEFYQQSLKIAEKIDDRASVATSLNNIGMVHYFQGAYEKALELYQQSLKIAEEMRNWASVAATLHQIGILHQEQGAYEKALELYQQSLKIGEEIGDRAGIAACLHEIGMLHQAQGAYQQALEFYQQSLQILEELGKRADIAASLHQIGRVHQDQGAYEKALEFYQQSLKIQEELGDRAGVATNLGQLGVLYEDIDQLENAIQALVNAFLLFAEMGMPEAAQAKGHLNRLRSRVGEEPFVSVLQSVGLPAETQSALLQALGAAQLGSEQPDLRQVLIRNTLAVLTDVPDKKGEWWDTLRKLEQQFKQANEQELVAYVHRLVRLVEGTDPATLTPGIPEAFKPDWQSILDGISEKE